MRKMPQDFAFPLGMGSKRQQQNNHSKHIPNGDGPYHNHTYNKQLSNTTIETQPPNTIPDESVNL